MTEDQGDQIIDLLRDLVEELRGLREDFNEFTGYNVYKMSTVIDDLSDRITGGIGGVGGATIDDLTHELREANAALGMIDVNTSP